MKKKKKNEIPQSPLNPRTIISRLQMKNQQIGTGI